MRRLVRTEIYLSVLLLGVLAAGACRLSRYSAYVSQDKDFRVFVPRSWSIETSRDGDHYSDATFIGPFDPQFYRGFPSFIIRWYSYSYPHRIPDGPVEMYGDARDYIRQVLAKTYGPKPILIQAPENIVAGGRLAMHFVVFSPVLSDPSVRWGVIPGSSPDKLYNLREHAYVVVPLPRGFYVLIYPATREGYSSYEPQFNELVNTFLPQTDGPGGLSLSP